MTKLKLNVHCEINETIEMTFKIKTKLDTSKWTHQLQKKKKILKKKKISIKFFEIFFQKKNFQKHFFFKKKIY